MNVSPSNSISFIKQNSLLLRNFLSDLSFNLPFDIPNHSSDIKKNLIEFQLSLASQDEFLNEFLLKKKVLTAFLEKFDLLDPIDRESNQIYNKLSKLCSKIFMTNTLNAPITIDFMVTVMQKLQNYQVFLLKTLDSMQTKEKEIMKQQLLINEMAVKVKPPEEPLLNEMPPENLNGKLEIDLENMKEKLMMLQLEKKKLSIPVKSQIMSPILLKNEENELMVKEESLIVVKFDVMLKKIMKDYEETLGFLKGDIESTIEKQVLAKEQLELEEKKTSGYFFKGNSLKKQELIKTLATLKENLILFEEKMQKVNEQLEQEKKSMETEKNLMTEKKRNMVVKEIERRNMENMKIMKEMEENRAKALMELENNMGNMQKNIMEIIRSIKENKMNCEKIAREKQVKMEKMKQNLQNLGFEEEKMKKMMLNKEILINSMSFGSEKALSDFSMKMQKFMVILEEFVQNMKVIESYRKNLQMKMVPIFEVKGNNEEIVEKIIGILERF